MMNYQYKAVDSTGQMVEGTLAAANEGEALGKLSTQGLLPIRLLTADASGGARLLPSRRPGAPLAQRLLFKQQMASLMSAGIPLDRALGLAAQSGIGTKMSRVVEKLRSEVLAGQSLSAAMLAQPGAFDRLYTAIVETGERSGDMAGCFAKVEEHLTSQQELRSTLLTALVYPIFLTLVSGGSVTFLMLVVVPKFTRVLTETGRPLPAMTQALLTATHLLTAWGWTIPVALAAIYLGFLALMRLPSRRLSWDRAKLRWPLFGALFQRINVVRFTRTLATLLRAGTPMLQALKLAAGVLTNAAMADMVSQVAEGLKEGQPVSAPLGKDGIFPSVAIQMMSIGEETGRLEEMMEKIALTYDRETQRMIKRMVGLLEPTVILVMGLIVGFIVISILMGIVAVNDIPL